MEAADDPDVWMFVAEAPLKAASISCNTGLPAMGLGGVLAGAHDPGESRTYHEVCAHPAMRKVSWKGRMTVIAFDASISDPKKPLVSLGAAYAAIALKSLGADVWLMRIPYQEPAKDDFASTGKDQGPDDYIARNGADAFFRLVFEAVRADPIERLRPLLELDPLQRSEAAQGLLSELPILAYLHASERAHALFDQMFAARKLKTRPIREAMANFKRRLIPKKEERRTVDANVYSFENNITAVREGQDEEGEPTWRKVAPLVAEITEDVHKDNGVEREREFTVSGAMEDGSELPSAHVSAAHWLEREWLPKAWGAKAHVEAARSSWDHFLAATSQRSHPRTRTIYTHTGWRKIEDRWVYLLPENSIGEGAAGLEVANPDQQGRFGMAALPEDAEEIKHAVASSFSALTVGKLRVTVPVFCAIWLAPVYVDVRANFSILLVGKTGTGKSGLAGLAAGFFGEWSFDSPPLSWSATPAAIERVLFHARDTVVVVDDFVPGAEKGLDEKATRILQSIGNRTGRERNNRANEAQASRPPRAMVLSTGEDLPITRTASTLARALVDRIEPGDLAIHGAGGIVEVARQRRLHQIAMRSYLAHIANHYELRIEQIAQYASYWASESDGVRAATRGAHARTALSIGLLIAAAESYLDYAGYIGAITAEKQKTLFRSVEEWMTHLAAAQVDYSGESSGASPADRWMAAISALLTSKRAALAIRVPLPDRDGESAASDLSVTGIGWIDRNYLYLSAELSWNAVRMFYDRDWPYNQNEVHRQLADRGVIEKAASIEGGCGTQRIARRVRLGGTQHSLLWVPRHWFENSLPKEHRPEETTNGINLNEV
ncbi:MAG TPA: DUF927 domain-containing protein [Polyangiaceae bacterium]|nr:DUF927 domain-containing protein [Polyangiaceae bacterium]